MATTLNIPQLYFEYGSMYDKAICANRDTKPITQPMIQDLKAHLPEITQQWNKDGAPLLAQTVALMNVPFTRHEVTVNVLLCDIPPSGMSYPLIVKLRHFLPASTDNVLPGFYLNGIVHHELLHRYLSEYFNTQIEHSQLLIKYQGESELLRNHLHLLALQQYTYITLNREAEFNEMMKIQAQRPNTEEYVKAYQIVTREGYQTFVNELLV